MQKKLPFTILILFVLPFCFWRCEEEDVAALQLQKMFVGNSEINLTGDLSTNLPVDRSITVVFSAELKQSSTSALVVLKSSFGEVGAAITISGNSIIIFPNDILVSNTIYTVVLSAQIQGAQGEKFEVREVSFKTALQNLQVSTLVVGETPIEGNDKITDVPLNLSLTITFSDPVNTDLLRNAVSLTGTFTSPLQFVFGNENKTVSITTSSSLKDLTKYIFSISATLKGAAGEGFSPYSRTLYTTVAGTPKFPVITDEELLTKVQQQTFKYFYDFAHPASGMARERNTSGDIVTSGGTGFGIMALIVGMERNFITRSHGVSQMNKIVSFLESADRFHGAWSHWINGSTGRAVPFSAKDDGGDLVETSFLVQGLLTFRQYLEPTDTIGNNLINRINTLWKTVEWDWYRKNNEEVLYWHWSPTYNWEMNFPLYGYFEQQITYVLAAASPTHSIPKSVYVNGFARNGTIETNKEFYGYTLPAGDPSPLFWVQYSYLGLDPHFNDGFIDYWQQNVNATKINYAYCVTNPKKYVGYSESCWGLTSSDNQNGYSAHSPLNDLGVITPTAALSSFPYTPDKSMSALKFFYYQMGDRLWGPYGFYDAFNLNDGWTATSYLAIDQGPIVVMIENYRTGLLWELFMSAPEIQTAFAKLSFTKSN